MADVVAVCRRTDYTLTVERHEDNLWAHAEVRRWSHTVARTLKRDVDTLIAELGPVAITPTEDRASGVGYETFRKFAAFCGFGFYRTKTVDGVRRAIYARWR
jgi:hypothetical protein